MMLISFLNQPMHTFSDRYTRVQYPFNIDKPLSSTAKEKEMAMQYLYQSAEHNCRGCTQQGITLNLS